MEKKRNQSPPIWLGTFPPNGFAYAARKLIAPRTSVFKTLRIVSELLNVLTASNELWPVVLVVGDTAVKVSLPCVAVMFVAAGPTVAVPGVVLPELVSYPLPEVIV